MAEDDRNIRSECAIFACRICRTKAGWRHQNWCELSDITSPTCADCRYYSAKDKKCIHPLKKNGGAQT